MVEKLVEYLKQCSDAYYNTDKVLVDNDTYDAMVGTLRRIAPDHPYLQEVGASPREDTSKVGRLEPMGTLAKYHTTEDVKSWVMRENQTFYLAPKYDGFGVELVYKDGNLIMASTRGDGHVGEDITSAMMRVRNLPLKVPASLTRVRGEAIIPRENHEKMKELGYSAMRNAVPGIVKSNRVDALLYVDFVAYEFFDGTDDRLTQRESYGNLFTVEEHTVAMCADEFDLAEDWRNWFSSERETYKYETDGVVLKTVEIQQDNLLCPDHQIAWKFKSNRETTTLRSIEFQVGATGNISVVGIFDEVEFQGAKLKRASLGSIQRYEEMKPAVGDLVEVSRRGDIIPYIEEVVLSTGDYVPQTVCPCCGEPLVEYKCVNNHCSDRVKLKIYQFVKGIGVKGIGYALVESLVNNDILEDLSDIYLMDPMEILQLPRQGKSSVEKWRDLQKKEVSTLQFLTSYPFENVGKSTWQSILEKYQLSQLLTLTKEDLESSSIKGLGSGKIESLITQLQDSKEEITKLIELLHI